MPFKTCLRISSLDTLLITFEISPSSVAKSLTSARGALSGPWYGRNTTVTVSPVSKRTPVTASRPLSSCVLLISVESSPLWRSKYSGKKPPLDNVFTLAILIQSRKGDEEMYIVETLAKNRRLYTGEGKGCKTIGGNCRDRRRASRSAYGGKRQASAISGAKRLIRCWKRTGAGC